MPQRLLTDRFCLSAKSIGAEAQTDYFDEVRKGLALRVTRAGTRSWSYHFTLDAKRVRMTFGTYPATGLAQARTLADEARAALEDGKDPRTALAASETFGVARSLGPAHGRRSQGSARATSLSGAWLPAHRKRVG